MESNNQLYASLPLTPTHRGKVLCAHYMRCWMSPSGLLGPVKRNKISTPGTDPESLIVQRYYMGYSDWDYRPVHLSPTSIALWQELWVPLWCLDTDIARRVFVYVFMTVITRFMISGDLVKKCNWGAYRQKNKASKSEKPIPGCW